MKRFSLPSTVVALCVGVLALSPGTRLVAAGHPEKALLWKIEGKGLEKPSYLFGTIHITPPEIQELHPAAEKAFTASEVVHTEIPLDTKSQISLAPKLMRADGKKLADSLGPELSAALEAELKVINPQLSAAPFQPLKTWIVSMSLPILKYQIQGMKGLDSTLWERATVEIKKTSALESLDSQVSMLDGFSEAEQITMLSESIEQMKEDRQEKRDPVAELISAYQSGDPEKVQAEVEKSSHRMAAGKNKELGERLMKRVLFDRNVTLAASIEKALQADPGQTHFFAIGAAHYLGKQSVRDYLTEKGYQITPAQD